jgi:hypothetical protein
MLLEFFAATLIAGFIALALIGHAALLRAVFLPPQAPELPGIMRHA